MTNGDPDFGTLSHQVSELSRKFDGMNSRLTNLEGRRREDADASARLEGKVDKIDDTLNQARGVLNAIRVLASIATILAAIVAVLVLFLAHSSGT